MKKRFYFFLVATLAIYIPSLMNFFSSDDWFHLRISSIHSIGQFLNFFSFAHTPQSISFYRPLTTQTFFYILQKLFGFNPIPYHIFVLACFVFSVYLVYKLAHVLLKSDLKALFVSVIYGFSVSNFTRLYFLSAFQEIGLVIFCLLCILNYLKRDRKHNIYSLFFFLLALLSKETSVVIPFILLSLDWVDKKTNLKRIIPFLFLLLPYLYLRLFVFQGAAGDSYIWNFSPLKAANTLMWYVLWSIGAPELLVDYIGSGLKPIPQFFVNFPIWWVVILGLLIPTIILLGILLFKNLKKIDRRFIVFTFLFVISLAPVLFLPQHKFTLELGLPLVWFSLAVSWLLPNKGKLLWTFFGFYLTLNLSMNYLTYTTHYSVQRGMIAKKIFTFITQNYPQEPKNSYFEFINDTPITVKEWGSSRQIANAIGGSEMFRVIYNDPKYNVYFQDIPASTPVNKAKISLSTAQFLRP